MIPEGPPKDDVSHKYRQELWDLFLPVRNVTPARRKQNLKRRFVLNYYLNGKLQQQEVQHFCLHGCCSNIDATLRRICRQVVWALVPGKPPVFARSRWTRWDAAIDAIAILGGVHGLLRETFLSYLGEKDEPVPQNAPTLPGSLQALSDWEDVFEEEVNTAKGTLIPTAAASDGKKDEQGPPSVQAGSGNPTVPEQSQTFAEFNKQQKLLAKDWVKTDPFTRLCIMKEVASELMHLMYVFLRFSGLQWEKQQRFRSSKGQARSYIILEAAKGKDVQECMERLYRLLPNQPSCVGDMQYTLVLKALRFRMVSCALCSIHILLRLPRQGFPFNLFKLLLSDEHAQVLLDRPPCFRDALSHEILSKYDPWSLVWSYGENGTVHAS